MLIPLLAQLVVAIVVYFVPGALPYKALLLVAASVYIWWSRLEWLEAWFNGGAVPT